MKNQNAEKIKNITESVLNLDNHMGIKKSYVIHIIQQLFEIILDSLEDTNDDDKWIDISTPPLEDGSYLVCTKKKTVCTARFYTSANKFSSRLNDSIVAWMPLPKPLSTIDNRKEYR